MNHDMYLIAQKRPTLNDHDICNIYVAWKDLIQCSSFKRCSDQLDLSDDVFSSMKYISLNFLLGNLPLSSSLNSNDFSSRLRRLKALLAKAMFFRGLIFFDI